MIFPKQGEFIFPIADGRIKTLGGDQELRTSTLIWHRPIQGESHIDFLGESEGSLPQPHDSLPDAGEAMNDFWSMSGSFIQGVSPHWGVMLTQAPIWGNRGWETKFLFHAPVSLDWGAFRLTPLCTFPNFPRLWLRVGVALFPQIGVVLRRKV